MGSAASLSLALAVNFLNVSFRNRDCCLFVVAGHARKRQAKQEDAKCIAVLRGLLFSAQIGKIVADFQSLLGELGAALSPVDAGTNIYGCDLIR